MKKFSTESNLHPLELRELVTNIGLPILIALQTKCTKDIKSQVTKSQFSQDALLFYVPTDILELQLFVIQTKKHVNKPNKFLMMMMKSLLIKSNQLLIIIHTWLNKMD